MRNISLLLVLLAGSALLATCIGSESIPPLEVVSILAGKTDGGAHTTIVMQVRLPRINGA